MDVPGSRFVVFHWVIIALNLVVGGKKSSDNIVDQFDPMCFDLGGNHLSPEVLKLGRAPVSFELVCNRLEAVPGH